MEDHVFDQSHLYIFLRSSNIRSLIYSFPYVNLNVSPLIEKREEHFSTQTLEEQALSFFNAKQRAYETGLYTVSNNNSNNNKNTSLKHYKLDTENKTAK